MLTPLLKQTLSRRRFLLFVLVVTVLLRRSGDAVHETSGRSRGVTTSQRDLESKRHVCGQRLDAATVKISSTNLLRFGEVQLKNYLDAAASDNKFEGWLVSTNIYMVGFLSKVQHYSDTYGTVGEIGVHHGKFTIALSGFALVGEATVAVDLFSMQEENTDGSGKGNLENFNENLRRFSLLGDTHVIQKNSLTLTPADFSALPPFRLISVDGGHTHTLTLNDLLVACNLITEGGIIILDDFVNMDWLGVVSGAFEFIHAQKIIVPFLWLSNKLYFTTAESHGSYVSAIERIHEAICDNQATFLARARGIFPFPICIVKCEEAKVKEACVLLSSPNGTLEMFAS